MLSSRAAPLENGGIVLMRACRPGPFKKWSVLLRITAYYRVLNGAYYRLAPPGPPDFPENLGSRLGGQGRITIPPFLSGLISTARCNYYRYNGPLRENDGLLIILPTAVLRLALEHGIVLQYIP